MATRTSLSDLFKEVYSDSLIELATQHPSILQIIQAEDRRNDRGLYAPVILETEQNFIFANAESLELRLEYTGQIWTIPVEPKRKYRKFHR